MRVGHLIGGNGHSLELRNGTRIIHFKSENESLVVEVDLEVPEAANQANPHEPQWRDPSPPETSPPLADIVSLLPDGLAKNKSHLENHELPADAVPTSDANAHHW